VSPRRIISIGFSVPGDDVEDIPFKSDQSLLDADIILFQPTIGEPGYAEHFQGKRSLDENQSFQLKERLSHWKAELNAAIDAGKLVIVFLASPEGVFVRTGEKQYSGTGRNRQVTNIVTEASSYGSMPFQLEVHPRRGSSIVRGERIGVFAQYWDAFGEYSPYEVTVESNVSRVLLMTKAGEKTVGATLSFKKGAVHLLPPLLLEEGASRSAKQSGKRVGRSETVAFSKRLVATLVALDDAIRVGSKQTPAPHWAQSAEHQLEKERQLEVNSTDITARIRALQIELEEVSQKRQDAGNLRRLLYGQGPELEKAIIEALSYLGFKAEAFKDHESEFDAVFVSPDGMRFLGEAEGKDSSAVNVDKFSQLERNIQEDYAKEGTTEFARGVLFGNAYRFTPPNQRQESFTPKCLSSAKRSGVALIRTPDLFAVARYLSGADDPAFAAQCREAITAGAGSIVVFPTVPASTHPRSDGPSTGGAKQTGVGQPVRDTQG